MSRSQWGRCRQKKLVAVTFGFLLLLSASVVATLGKTRNRRWSVRPMNRNRLQCGHYENLVKFMKSNDKEQFFKYTRLTPQLFDHLLSLVGPYLKKHPSRKALSPEQRLVMTLHYLSQGSSMQEIAWMFYVGKSTVHYVLKETCNVLWEQLMPVYLSFPSREDLNSIIDGYYKRWNMPNCFGALDGKHVLIQAPKHSGSEFFSYKKSFSLVLMATCDAFYKFSMVDIGGAGCNHDASTFKNSLFGEALLKNELEIPAPQMLPKTNKMFPNFLVADQAFPLQENIMRPYPGEHLNDTKKIFNYRLSRARRTIENTFGILAQRWRILRKPIIADITTCEEIVKATVVLHNFVQLAEEDIPENERMYCPTGFADYVDENGVLHLGQWRNNNLPNALRDIGRLGANNASRRVQGNRDTLAEYFVSNAGSVPWQENTINAGRLPL